MIALLLPLMACKHPPQAPEDLDTLVGFMFEHLPDEDPELLEASAVNLQPWLVEQLEETLEGYAINNLSDEAMAGLGEGDLDLSLLHGAAVGHESPHSVDDLVDAMLFQDALDVYGNTYSAFKRDWEGNLDCFKAKTCIATADVTSTSSYAGLITVDSHSGNFLRWIDTDMGRMMIYRAWLFEPAVVDPATLLVVDRQYFLNVVLDTDDGPRALQAIWAIAEPLIDVDEGFALQMMINGMAKNADAVDEWLDKN